MKTAVIYARYSCDKQTEQSIDGQLSVCNEYAKKNNLIIIKNYIDQAMSGTNDNRPAFQQMIKESANKEWDYVLVYKLDRFSRDKYETAIHKKKLKDNGVKVLSAMENIPDTPEGIILESLLEGMNQYYSAELAQKVRRGMKETRKKGLFQGGKVLYGYKVVGRKLEIDENVAPIIKYIFEQHAAGICIREIIEELTKNGVLKKGKPLAMNTVYGILKNPKYTGVYKFKDEIIDNMYPPIISEELFKKVASMIELYKHTNTKIKEQYYLRKKIFCGYCGMPLQGETGTSVTGTINKYYKCSGRKRLKTNCEKTVVRKKELENLIINSIYKELKKPESINAIVNGLLAIQKSEKIENSVLTNLIKAKANTEMALNNLISAAEQGFVSKNTNKRLHELETQIEDIEKKIASEKTKEKKMFTAKEIEKYFKKMITDRPETLITFALEKATLYNDKIVIRLKSPIEKSPDDGSGNATNRDFCFYHKIVKLNKEKLDLYMIV